VKTERTAGRKPEKEEGRERVQSNDLLQDKQNFVRAKYERILQGVYIICILRTSYAYTYHTFSFFNFTPLCTSFYTRADH